MTLALPVALLLPVIGGALFLYMVWPQRRPPVSDLLLILALGAGLGLGVSAAAFFAWLVGFGPSKAYFVLELLGLAVLVGFVLRRLRQGAAGLPSTGRGEPARVAYVSWLLIPGFVLSLLIAILTFAFRSATSPHGGWDAAMIWNLRARFLFRGADHWRDAFSDLQGTWTHADYPLLVPGSVARAWSLIGSDTIVVPILVASLFVLATAVLLLAALSGLRSRGQGMLAGIMLLCSHPLVWQGANQYADVPLAFFILAGLVTLALADKVREGGAGFIALAGLSAGLAAWAKNEGLLFLVALFAAHLAVVGRLRGWRVALRREAIMGLGLAPVLLVIVAFKWGIAPGNDLLASLTLSDLLERLTDPRRYGYVLSAFGRLTLEFGGWIVGALFVLASYLLALGWKVEAEERPAIATAALTLILVLTGYFFVYVVTPHELAWHVGTSMHRLALHGWPSLLFVYFLIARTPEEASVQASTS